MPSNPRMAAIPYYGGKFRLSKKIVPIIGAIDHNVYCEPFCGGGSVFWGLHDTNKTLVLNDMNKCLMIMYRMMRMYPTKFIRRINGIPFSRFEYQQAKFFLGKCDTTDDSFTTNMTIAISSYITLCMSFSNIMGDDGGWRVDKKSGADPMIWSNRKEHISSVISKLDNVYLDCSDYTSCIARWDSESTLFMIDPPYPDTDLGHYGSTAKEYSVGKFTMLDLEKLYRTIDKIKGKFILTGYDTDVTKPQVSDTIITKTVRKIGTRGINNSDEYIWIRSS